MRIKVSAGEKAYISTIVFFMCFMLVITLYPFIYTISMSISKPVYAAQNVIWLLPKGFSLESYKMVFDNQEIWQSYYNTIWYTLVGTFVNVVLTVVSAYPLSRRTFFAKNFIIMFVAFTMFFGGGMIPTFLLIKNIGLYNTRWAMILPGAINAWNLIIARTYFETIPESLQESAKIDGANDIKILFRIMIPLAMPIIAVLILFYAVGYWNSYFNALIYLPNPQLQPLQIYLRKVLILQSQEGLQGMEGGFERSVAAIQLKYSTIIVSILPILCVYPFLQKYFVKGVMIGAIKE